MSKINVPDYMSFEFASKNWTRWRQKFEIYLQATGKHEMCDKTKIAVLLNLIGDDGLDVYNSFDVNADECSLETILDLFKQHFTPKNSSVESIKFNCLMRRQEQTVESFANELKRQAEFCDYKCGNCEWEYKERMIEERFLIGVNDLHMQNRLLRERGATLRESIELCKTFEDGCPEVLLKSEVFTQSNQIHWRANRKNCDKCVKHKGKYL